MSNHLDPFSNPLNIETIQEIDNLDLSIMQKHHLRILAHCLQILKLINVDNSLEYQNKNPLREWCDKQSKKFVYNILELFLIKDISVSNSDVYNYFLKRINDFKKFNLDDESLFLEINSKLLNG